MKYAPRDLQRAVRAAALDLVAIGSAVLLAVGCRKAPAEPAPPAADASNATTAPAASVAGGGASPGRILPPHAPNEHLAPHRSGSPPDPPGSALIPAGAREPDWDLDTSDTARDYVRRYALATKRYGDTLACADIGPSQPAGDRRRVEVKTAASCPGGGALRDVFLVDVAGDRLTVDDDSRRGTLTRWPDGSDPEGPPAPVVSLEDMRKWRGPVRDAFRDLQLAPIRVQGYGRGSYPVVTIAGWHGKVTPATPAGDLKDVADRLCKASLDGPLAVFGGLDRSTILRIRCAPAAATWDRL